MLVCIHCYHLYNEEINSLRKPGKWHVPLSWNKHLEAALSLAQ